MPNANCLLAAWPLAAILLALNSAPARSELAPPNAAGVSMGQLHYFVDDMAAHRAFWVALGGHAMTVDADVAVNMPDVAVQTPDVAVQMPGVVVLIRERAADTVPATIDHVAFRVASLDAIEARGFTLERLETFPGIALIRTPGGDRVELFEEGMATNVGFAPDVPDAVAERHNRPLVGSLASHHLHFYLPEAEVEAARDWYVLHFGAVPGQRWRYAAADLPGMNLNFSAADTARQPTRGRTLDHIGFEVADLEAFCRELEGRGLVFEQPFRRTGPEFALAVLTDPWGTTIELTQGLRRR